MAGICHAARSWPYAFVIQDCVSRPVAQQKRVLARMEQEPSEEIGCPMNSDLIKFNFGDPQP